MIALTSVANACQGCGQRPAAQPTEPAVDSDAAALGQILAATAALVTQALNLCERAGRDLHADLELPVLLLRDALDCLTSGDFGKPAATHAVAAGEGPAHPYPSHRHPPSRDDRDEVGPSLTPEGGDDQ